MGPDPGEDTVITDVVAGPVLVDIAVDLISAGERLDQLECLQHRTGVIFPASKIVNLTTARIIIKSLNETRNIERMNIVPHLLPLITINVIKPLFDIAFNQVTEKPM